jgi:hypothetical protein
MMLHTGIYGDSNAHTHEQASNSKQQINVLTTTTNPQWSASQNQSLHDKQNKAGVAMAMLVVRRTMLLVYPRDTHSHEPREPIKSY